MHFVEGGMWPAGQAPSGAAAGAEAAAPPPPAAAAPEEQHEARPQFPGVVELDTAADGTLTFHFDVSGRAMWRVGGRWAATPGLEGLGGELVVPGL